MNDCSFCVTQEAEAMHKKAIEIKEKILGSEVCSVKLNVCQC